MLTKSQLRYIRYIRTRAFTIYKTRSVCDVVSFYIEKKFGYIRIRGSYKSMLHYYNILPNGLILDCTFDQFDASTPINIIADCIDYE